jgi:hypothetical protein
MVNMPYRNAEDHNAEGRRYYQRNKEKTYLRTEKYRKEHPEVARIQGARARCSNPKNPSYPHYGGRGIKCLLSGWQDVVNVIGPWPGEGYSLDRINNDGNYEITNIRWADKKTQMNNRSI